MKAVFRQCSRILPLILILLLLSACNMTGYNSPWSSLAKGGNLPAELAIASGDRELMLDCFHQLFDDFKSGGIAGGLRAEAALDMIDLLAVLSDVVRSLIPYILDGADPTNLDELSDFLDSANQSFLLTLGSEQFINDGEAAGPSPLQYFWSALGLHVYLLDQYGPPPVGIPPGEHQFMLDLLDSAEQEAADSGNNQLEAFFTQFESLFVAGYFPL